jgi:hypothetical protein
MQARNMVQQCRQQCSDADASLSNMPLQKFR